MPGQAEKEKSKASISNQSSEKLLQLIEFLSEQEEPLRLLDISRQTGMNQSTASRFLSALKRLCGPEFPEREVLPYL